MVAADPQDVEVGMEPGPEPIAESPKPVGVGFLESAPEALAVDVDVAVPSSISLDDSKLHVLSFLKCWPLPLVCPFGNRF